MKTPHRKAHSAILDAPQAPAPTGICRFCRRTLTDPRSVQIGYGPDCAQMHGLYYPDRRGARRAKTARRNTFRRPGLRARAKQIADALAQPTLDLFASECA